MYDLTDRRGAGVSEAIAHCACGLNDGDIAPGALGVARLSFFDWLAVTLAGMNEPVCRIVRQFVLSERGADESMVFGTQHKIPARAAAMANGTMGHALDYDDTHFAYLGHPGAVVFPAALAVAQKVGADGIRLLTGALIGMEAAIRIGAWLGRQHHLIGFHSTATVGSFGATVAVSRLLQLNAIQTQHALGLAASRSSGLRAQFGTMAKPFHAGMAASNGVEAALLAQAGFLARPNALECDQGFAPTHGAEINAPADALQGLGEVWKFEAVLPKFHACCHGAHAALEAVLRLRDDANLQPQEVRHVLIAVPPRYLEVCNIPEPTTALEAKFSYRLCTAMILSGRDTAALATYSDACCRDPELLALRDRVAVTGRAGLDETEAEIRIETMNGHRLEARYDINQPMDFSTRTARLRAKAKALLSENPACELWDAVTSNDLASLEAVCQAFSSKGRR